MGSNPDYTITLIVPAAGAPVVAPEVLRVSHTGGTLRWAIYCARSIVERVKIEFESGTTITFPTGAEQPVNTVAVPPDNPYKKQGSIDANVPANTGTISILEKYTGILLTGDGTEIDRIDPFIIVDTP
jgi:hypothetical protein